MESPPGKRAQYAKCELFWCKSDHDEEDIGEPAGGAMRVVIMAGPMDLAQSGAAGDGLRTARAGVPTSFVIEARDRFGNLCGVGGERWLVRLVPEAAEEAALADAARAALGTLRVDDGGDGSYTVTATLGRTGRYRWEIAHDDLARRGVEAPPAAPLPGGPWTLRVVTEPGLTGPAAGPEPPDNTRGYVRPPLDDTRDDEPEEPELE